MIRTVEPLALTLPLELVRTSSVAVWLQSHWYYLFLILSLVLGAIALYLWRTTPSSAENGGKTFMPTQSPVRDKRQQQTLIDATRSRVQQKPQPRMMLEDVLAQNHAPARLIVQQTPAKIKPLKQVPISKLPFTLGRVECDLTITEPHVSRKHAKIVQHGERFYLVDLKSSNFTFLAGQPVKAGELTPLRPNSTIKLGRHTVLRFEC